MKRWLLFLGLLVAVVAFGLPADALQFTRAYKNVVVNIVVTPSPIVYFAPAARPRVDGMALTANPRLERPQFASSSATVWDIAPRLVAQAAAQPTGVPVQFVAKPDPTSTYLRLTPNNATINAGYGTNPTYACVYSVHAYYSTGWKVIDWGFGTSPTAGSGSFPIWNYAAVSNLTWLAEGVTTSFKAFANDGSPGENVLIGVAGSTQDVCIDLQLYVPPTQPAGIYTATIQYTLITS